MAEYVWHKASSIFALSLDVFHASPHSHCADETQPGTLTLKSPSQIGSPSRGAHALVLLQPRPDVFTPELYIYGFCTSTHTATHTHTWGIDVRPWGDSHGVWHRCDVAPTRVIVLFVCLCLSLYLFLSLSLSPSPSPSL